MTGRNYLLGRGERLTEDVTVRKFPGDKKYPYTFDEAKSRLAPMLDRTIAQLDQLPADACPNDTTVIAMTLHPSFIA